MGMKKTDIEIITQAVIRSQIHRDYSEAKTQIHRDYSEAKTQILADLAGLETGLQRTIADFEAVFDGARDDEDPILSNLVRYYEKTKAKVAAELGVQSD